MQIKWFSPAVVQRVDSNAGVVSSNSKCNTINAPLVRKATGKHLIKSTYHSDKDGITLRRQKAEFHIECMAPCPGQ